MNLQNSGGYYGRRRDEEDYGDSDEEGRPYWMYRADYCYAEEQCPMDECPMDECEMDEYEEEMEGLPMSGKIRPDKRRRQELKIENQAKVETK